MTVLPHPAVYEVPLPSASVGKVLPVENGTAFAVPAQPTVGGAAATSAGGSPREAGTMRAVSKGGVGRVGVSGWVGVFGVVGLVVVLG